MTMYEEGLNIIEEKFGNGKDNVISLATIAREPLEFLYFHLCFLNIKQMLNLLWKKWYLLN